MKAVFLDTDTFGKDFDLSSLKKLPVEWSFYLQTQENQVIERIASADIIVTNKIKLTKDVLAKTSAKLICGTATGYDNIDLQASDDKGIAVCNIPAYSTPSVVQHTMTFILMLSESILLYLDDIKNGRWQESSIFTFLDYPFFELQGKKLGIVGYGNLGKEVARIAKAFGMEILIAQGRKENPDAIPLSEVLQNADYVSLHVGLNPQTRNMIGENEMSQMKPSAYLINVSRGGIVNEEALAKALKNKTIAGAAFDVLTSEPPAKDHPLLQKDIPNFILTPHIAWGSLESRMRAIEILEQNIQAFLSGKPQNIVQV